MRDDQITMGQNAIFTRHVGAGHQLLVQVIPQVNMIPLYLPLR